MAKDQNQELDNWDLFAGDWIKAEFVPEDTCKLPVTHIEVQMNEDDRVLVATVEYHGKTWNFSLNKTNQSAIRLKGLMPKDVVGKVFVCGKTMVRNPRTGAQQPSLVITDIE